MLQETFLPRKPSAYKETLHSAYVIYAEVFTVKKDAYIPTEIFIIQKQALFAELPQPHPEDLQNDIICLLLKSQIQKNVSRNSITSFDQLINAAHRVEQSKNDKRVRRFENYDFKVMSSAAKLEEKCSQRKTRKSKRSGGTEMYR